MPRRDRPAAKPEWLSPLRRAGGPVRSRLVVVPYAAAGATALRPVLTGLPEDVELLGVSLPGRERRFGEPPAGSIEEIVEPVVAELTAREPVPTTLFGHCMGASLAVVLALRHPELFGGLVVSGQDPPGGRGTRPTWKTPRSWSSWPPPGTPLRSCCPTRSGGRS
ncbi:thioesterase II family protein [Catenulispora yoronensis]